MSTRSYSKHIPDFRLVTHFAESGTSIIHAMSPWTKAALLGSVVALATVLMNPILLLTLFLLTLLFYLAAQLPMKVLVGWYTMPVLFVVTLAILFVFTEPGTEIASLRLGPTTVRLTDDGILLIVKLLLRALAVVTLSLAVFMTTKYSNIAHMAQKTLPGPLASVFLLSYRFLFVSSDEVTDVLDAMNARNGNLVRGVLRESKLYASIFGLSFVHAFERAERIGKAMESRGFTGSLPAAGTLTQPSYGGYSLLGVGCVMLVLAVYTRYFNPGLLNWW
jgi:cobalt/nickel transport system permease protein